MLLVYKSFVFTGIAETAIELSNIVDKCISLALEKHSTYNYTEISSIAVNMIIIGKLMAIWHSMTCNSFSVYLLANYCNKTTNREN